MMVKANVKPKTILMRPKDVHTSMVTDYLERRNPVELHPTGTMSVDGLDYEVDDDGVCPVPERLVDVFITHGWEVAPGQEPEKPESKYALGEDNQFHKKEELPLVQDKNGKWYPKGTNLPPSLRRKEA